MKTIHILSYGIFYSKTMIMALFVFLMCCISFTLNGQGTKKIRTRMRLSYHNNMDNSKTLKAEVFSIKDRKSVPVIDEPVVFYIGEITEDDLLDSAITDQHGFATLHFPQDHNFPIMDDSREIPITAVFNGNEQYKEKSADINIKQVFMELFLTESNAVKTLSVRIYEIGTDQEMIPAEDATVNYYIPRLFSDQKIGESDIVNGQSSIEFPENFAGDSIGNITIIARIEDHDEYGYIERQVSDFRWGTKKPIEAHKDLMTIEITIPTRGLWHSNAPLWMIFTLIILLAGVWSHYFYVIYQLVKLSKLKSNKNNNVIEVI